MTNRVELDDLRSITGNVLSIYTALLRAQTLAAEGERVLAQADDLLQQAGLAYLLGDQNSAGGVSASGDGSPPTAIAFSYAQIQKQFAGLHTTLRVLADRLVADNAWADAQPLLYALSKLQLDDPELADLAARAVPLSTAQKTMDAGHWEEAREQLAAWLGIHPQDYTARALLRTAYFSPAQQALDAGEWEAVRSHIDPVAARA